MVNRLKDVIEGELISAEKAELMMSEILSGQVKAEMIGALLVSFNFSPPNGNVLAGFARAFRKRAVSFPQDQDLFFESVDVCGTGGDGHGTFNVSTSVAFLAAACGLSVAKHGNRAVSSRCGSFDVLEELGVAFAHTPEDAIQSVRRHGLTFMYAPSFHPALLELSPLRRTLGIRTVLNALGPLLNPAAVGRQLVGVYSPNLVVPMAECLGELGVREAMVVCGEDGSDEISMCSPTMMAHLQRGRISVSHCTPESFGFQRVDRKALLGGTAKENAVIIRSLLSGEKGPARDMVVMNTAAALLVGERVSSLKEGVAVAQATLDSGRAAQLLSSMAGSLEIRAAQ